MPTAASLKKQLKPFANPDEVPHKTKFFKAFPGGYGQGDKFLAIQNGPLRKLAKQNPDTPYPEIKKLLSSPIHEYRQLGLYILVYRYEKVCKIRTFDPAEQQHVFDFYLDNLNAINNWDLVDTSAYHILGKHLIPNPDRSILYQLAESKSLWEQRIAIISTYAFIRENDFADTLALSEKLLHHRHDLIHKAVGWMLREIGNRDIKVERKFINQHYKTMPRTMLRYAIEKIPETTRQKYLKG